MFAVSFNKRAKEKAGKTISKELNYQL